MLDLQHLPSNADVTKIVVATADAARLTTWHKRRGAQWVYLFGLGRAGNGGNGAGGGASYAGGGGGGSGGQTMVLIPAMMIPDTLYITNATNGNTLVGFDPTLSTQGLLLRANAGGNGGNATTTTVGSAGSAGTVATIATMPRAGGGFYTLLVGQGGTTTTADIAYPTTGLRVSGGAVGGAAGAAGGSGVVGKSVVFVRTPQLDADYTNVGGAAGANGVAGSPGNPGLSFPGYYLFAGGSGGGGSGGSGSVAGGRGGDCIDAYGCGGGGGGGGFLTGGAGGNGGPGLVLIAQW